MLNFVAPHFEKMLYDQRLLLSARYFRLKIECSFDIFVVPHFEKMLYDQGQLVNAYLDALCITKDPIYGYVAMDILDYLRRGMLHPEGGIYSAEDADSAEQEGATRKKEGAFYVWTTQEVIMLFLYHIILVCAWYMLFLYHIILICAWYIHD